MTTRAKGNSKFVDSAKQLIAGISKHQANMPQVMLVGSSLSPAQVIEHLQMLVDLRSDVDAAKAQTKAKLAAESAATPSLRIFMDAFVSFVKAAYGSAPDVLADFGIHPKARARLTVEAKTAAAAKRKATRAARHTTGPKQKKSVKGAVTGIVVTPVTAADHAATTTASPNAPATSTGTTTAGTPHAT